MLQVVSRVQALLQPQVFSRWQALLRLQSVFRLQPKVVSQLLPQSLSQVLAQPQSLLRWQLLLRLQVLLQLPPEVVSQLLAQLLPQPQVLSRWQPAFRWLQPAPHSSFRTALKTEAVVGTTRPAPGVMAQVMVSLQCMVFLPFAGEWQGGEAACISSYVGRGNGCKKRNRKAPPHGNRRAEGQIIMLHRFLHRESHVSDTLLHPPDPLRPPPPLLLSCIQTHPPHSRSVPYR